MLGKLHRDLGIPPLANKNLTESKPDLVGARFWQPGLQNSCRCQMPSPRRGVKDWPFALCIPTWRQPRYAPRRTLSTRLMKIIPLACSETRFALRRRSGRKSARMLRACRKHQNSTSHAASFRPLWLHFTECKVYLCLLRVRFWNLGSRNRGNWPYATMPDADGGRAWRALALEQQPRGVLRGAQAMGVASSNWFDRAICPILYMLRPSRWPTFKTPSLGHAGVDRTRRRVAAPTVSRLRNCVDSSSPQISTILFSNLTGGNGSLRNYSQNFRKHCIGSWTSLCGHTGLLYRHYFGSESHRMRPVFKSSIRKNGPSPCYVFGCMSGTDPQAASGICC